MIDALPAPMVPAEVDLRGLDYMPLLGGRLFESDFYLDADDAEFRTGVRLWWAAWNQVPAGSLPSADHRLRKLAGLEENASKWRKVKEVSLHGFVECSDGRLYHPVIAAQALIAWEKRAEIQAERDNTTERKRRDRAERATMFEQLRAVGVVPAWDIKKEDLRKMHAECVTGHQKKPPVTPPVTVTGNDPVTPPVTVTDTAKTGRDGTIEPSPIPPDGGKKSAAVGLKSWLEAVKAKGEKSIAETDPVFTYAAEVGIPSDFLRLAWLEFRHRYSQPDAKRYRDWRAVFRKAVRGNWLKLWFVGADGVYGLTTVGHQAQRAHEERRAA